MSTIELQAVSIRTSSHDTQARLVLIDGALTAVLVRLDDDVHGQHTGKWFLEAHFSQVFSHGAPLFASLEDATRWLRTTD